MYQVNVLICWISPLNQAVYGKHNLGYDPLLPKITHSYMFFLGILVLLAVFAINRMKNIPLNFLEKRHDREGEYLCGVKQNVCFLIRIFWQHG